MTSFHNIRLVLCSRKFEYLNLDRDDLHLELISSLSCLDDRVLEFDYRDWC